MKKLTAPLLALAASIAMAFVFCSSFSAGVAHAQGVAAADAAPSVPSVPGLTSPSEDLSTISKLYHSGSFFSLTIVVLFVGLGIADAKIAWLRQGRRGAYIAAGLGGLAMLATPAVQGTTPNMQMIMSALATAFALVMSPVKPQTATTTTTA